MAYVSSNSVKDYIGKETTFGVVPTAALRYELPRKAGSSLPVLSGNEITSDTIRAGLNGNGTRRSINSVSGNIELNAVTAEFVDLLLESALSNDFDAGTGILKASDKPVSFTHVSEVAANKFKISTGNMVNNFSLKADAAALVTMSFGFVGTKQVEAANINTWTGTLTPVPLEAYEYDGSELLNLTVAGGTNLKYSTVELSVESPRNPRNALSGTESIGFASQTRNVTATFSIWLDPAVDYNAIFTGEDQEFSFDLGITDYGRRFTMYGTASIPQTRTADDLMLDVTITGKLNTAEGTALKVTKL